ncbi:hypothetical protein [Methylobacillus sp.]|uniref:hypothetical protein n=1 Tax=Methylobacillus sp. TaxID=56818 RepID=UPI0012D01BC0|nr:hypothetical protein [Methylobacillus sp.]MPS48489.1 DUF1145 domain-containing protein [Methylobacillus sp.]
METLVLWALLLVCQNAAFTWVGRARASGSYGYHAIAAVFSNGIFFVTNLFVIKMVVLDGMTFEKLLHLGIIYVIATTTGSVLMHYITMNYFEKGNRKVGATNDKS